ncbi:hypothetical protein ACLB2K_064361 [Fragaria x ananassa]
MTAIWTLLLCRSDLYQFGWNFRPPIDSDDKGLKGALYMVGATLRRIIHHDNPNLYSSARTRCCGMLEQEAKVAKNRQTCQRQ